MRCVLLCSPRPAGPCTNPRAVRPRLARPPNGFPSAMCLARPRLTRSRPCAQDLDDIIAQVETKNRKVAEEAAAKEAAADIGKALASMQSMGGEKTYQIKVQSLSCSHFRAAALRTLFLAAMKKQQSAPFAICRCL